MYTMTPYRQNPGMGRPLMNDFFADPWFRSFFGPCDRMRPTGFRVDVKDEGDHYLLNADLPGITRDQIEITVQEDVLKIAADYATHSEEEKDSYVYSERRHGHIERSFSLEGINQDGITASCKDGVLTLTLPKVAPVETQEVRKIAIE